MEFYSLRIDGNHLYLDGIEVKGLNSYKLEHSENNIPMLTLKLYIEPDVTAKKGPLHPPKVAE